MGILESLRTLAAFVKFRREITSEMDDPDSKFNELGLQRNTFGDVLYRQYDFDENDLNSFDYDAERMVMSKVDNVTKYITEDLELGDVMVPVIQQFMVDDEPTNSYMLQYIFDGANSAVNTVVKSLIGIAGVSVLLTLVVCLVLA